MKFLLCVAGISGLLGGGSIQAADRVVLVSRAESLSDTAEGMSGFSDLTRTSEYEMSADGRYAVFVSNAPNLVSGQSGELFDNIFVHDRQNGTTALVSHSRDGLNQPGNNSSTLPSISADGRWIAFISSATDLLPGTTAPSFDNLYLYDRTTQTIVLASRSAVSGLAVGGTSLQPLQISSDGRWIAFGSRASDLVAGQTDTNGLFDVFLYDRETTTVTLVSRSLSSPTTAGNGASELPALSADGRYVSFRSAATNLTAETDTNGTYDLFVWDRETGTTTLVSRSAAVSATANGESQAPRISADGLWIAFSSRATDLITGLTDANFNYDLFLYERTTGALSLISHSATAATTTAQGYSGGPQPSADGSWIAFVSTASNLVPDQGNNNGIAGIFLYERATGTNTLISRSTTTDTGSSSGYRSTISADGNWIAFLSDSRTLIPGQIDSNFSPDLFLYGRASGTLALVSRSSEAPTRTGNDGSYAMALSADGRHVLYTTNASDLEAGLADLNEKLDISLYDRQTQANRILSRRAADMPALSMRHGAHAATLGGNVAAFMSRSPFNEENASLYFNTLEGSAGSSLLTPGIEGSSHFPVVSTNGEIAFVSAESFGYQDDNENYDIFLMGNLVSRSNEDRSRTSDTGAYRATLSADGRSVVLISDSTDLLPGPVEESQTADVFVWDSFTDEMTLVSRSADDANRPGNGTSVDNISISADGRWIAFDSDSTDLVPGGSTDGLFLFDRVGGTMSQISPGFSGGAALSADGRWIAFSSNAQTLVPGQIDPSNSPDVFLLDRVSGITTLVSRSAGSTATAANNGSGAPQISADGRWVAFTSLATNLVPGQVDANGGRDVFLFDRVSGEMTLVSHASGSLGTAANFSTDHFALSANGGGVAFATHASNLVPGQIDRPWDGYSTLDFFLYERERRRTRLVSRTLASPVEAANGGEGVPSIRQDGRAVLFVTYSPNLVAAGDYNGGNDVFAYLIDPPAADFYTVPPCRLLDTRSAGPALASGTPRAAAAAGLCGIPATADAIAANITVIGPAGPGYLTLYGGDAPPPFVSSINFGAGQLRSNNAVVSLALDGTLSLLPQVGGGGSVHVVVDVAGYFD